jgi:hypothetical protein
LTNLKKSGDSIDELEIYFCLEVEVEVEGENKVIIEELIPNGSNIKVTKENLDEYIDKR